MEFQHSLEPLPFTKRSKIKSPVCSEGECSQVSAQKDRVTQIRRRMKSALYNLKQNRGTKKKVKHKQIVSLFAEMNDTIMVVHYDTKLNN